MKKQVLLTLLSAVCFAATSPALAQDKVTIKLATRAPVGSTWETRLKEAAQKWTEISGGKVELKIFAGGMMGDEGDMIKKMNNNTLQAVGVSTVGLHVISPDPQALDLPLFAKNREQYRCMLGKMTPKLEALLADPYRGPDKTKKLPAVVVLAWGEIGFTRFFSTVARPTLAEMRKAKMFAWEGDPDSTKAWEKAGFKPVVLSSADLFPSLQTGKIDALCYPPVLVLAGNMHNKAKFMLDLPYSSLTGVTVVNKDAWEKIPADMRPKLLAVFREASAKIDQDVRKMEDDSIATLQKQGVTVVKSQDPGEWQKAMEEVYKFVRGTVVPAPAFDDARKALSECSAAK